MAKNITLMGASYTDVPAVVLPQTGGGTARFDDASVTTATAPDVTQGKIFLAADGTITTGTGTGGGGGGTPAPVKSDVNFYDYDGTLLHSYTATEAAELTALPSNPSHSGLVAQGWNYILEQIKAEVTAQGKCDVGQMYVTDDDKTRIYCTFPEGRLSPCLGICPNGTVVVDWGDGSGTDTLTGTNLTEVKTVQHTYASAGDYVITLTVVSGSFSFFGTSSATYLLTKDGTTDYTGRVYANAVTRVEMGSSAEIDNYAFTSCYSLSSITIPSGKSVRRYAFYNCYSLSSVTIPSGNVFIRNYAFYQCWSLLSVSLPSSTRTIEPDAFYGCYTLPSIVIPSGVTSLGAYAFRSCYALSSITIPSGVTALNTYLLYGCLSLFSVTIKGAVTTIYSYALNNCYALSSVTIPAEVTSISNYAFSNCYGVSEYHLKPVTPPTLGGTSVFQNMPTDCKIYVPYSQDHSILEAYKAATNWSTWQSYMLEEAAE